MSGRVVFSITEAQAAVLQAVAAGRTLPELARLVHVVAGLVRRCLIAGDWTGPLDCTAGHWRLTGRGGAVVALLQAEAADAPGARLAMPAGAAAGQGTPCPPSE